MQTDELITLLGADASPVPRSRLIGELVSGGGAGTALVLLLVLVWLGLRPDLATAAAGAFFWIKAAYTAALGAGGFWAVERLSRPGVAASRPVWLGASVLALFAMAALGQVLSLSDSARLSALRGVSWTVCTRNIVILAAPVLAATLLVMRRQAPTRLATAGFAAGVFSGGLAATLYGLHCPEATFVFVGLWYTLGVALSGAIGAALGRLMLRW